MGGDDWTDETIPSPRVRSDASEAAGDVREAAGDAPSSVGTSPIYVWLLGFVVLLLALASCGLWALYLRRGQIASRGPTPTAIIWTPTPVTPSPTSPSPPPTETVDSFPTGSSEIAIGRYVRVAGTGGAGLNLRSGPGKEYERMDVALDGEVFLVTEGPTVAGDSEWWKLLDPADAAREWWAIANFLEPIEHP